MSDPRITERAQADLDDLWDHLAERNEAAADRLVDEILERSRFHVRFPKTGRSRADIAPSVRSFVVRPYVIFFRAVDDTIEILRVLHGSRDIDSIMKSEELD
jgi:toxin ParE1/3/4